MEIRTVSLKDYSSLRTGGEGQIVEVETTAELIEVCMYAKKENRIIQIVGEGTNTYFGEKAKDLLMVKMNNKGISFEDHESTVLLTAYAGEVWDDLVVFSTNKGLWGIENLSYIPGTVGAAPVQNIGAYGRELQDVFISLSAVDTETFNIVEINKEACDFGYRDSLFKKEYGRYIIISLTIELSKVSNPVLTYKPLDTLASLSNITPNEVRDMVIATRKSKLPDWKQHPNAGSFFKNPVVDTETASRLKSLYPDIPTIEVSNGWKIPAAWLIEHVAEMKGIRVGDTGTWPQQPLVLVNYGESTANDIDTLAESIKKKVYDATAIILEQEVNRIG